VARGENEDAPKAAAVEDWGDWASNSRRKLILGLAATPDQRLRWLEDALELAAASGALARRRRIRDGQR
jgi:hypothetical protein